MLWTRELAAYGWRMEKEPQLAVFLYLTPEVVDLGDAMAFEYRDAMLHSVQNKRRVYLGVALHLYLSDEKESADNKVYRITVTVKVT